MSVAWIPLVLFVAASLAGCLGEGGPTGQSAEADAAVGFIRGVVHNDASLPLAGARVSLLESDAFQETGRDGAFRFDNVSVGRHVVRVEAAGFKAMENDADVGVDNVTELLFHLVPLEQAGAGYRAHTHDFWGDKSELTIMDEAVDFNQPSSTSGVGGPLVWRASATAVHPNNNRSDTSGNYRLPIPSNEDPPSLVYPGTKEIQVTLSWTTSSSTAAKVGLKYRAFNSQKEVVLGRLPTGGTWKIPVAPGETDTGHQMFSLWNFWVYPAQLPAEDGANYRPGLVYGPFQVKIKVLKGEVLLEEPHEDFWGGKLELLLHDHPENVEACNSAYRVVERDTAACKKAPRRIVPPGTARLVVELKWSYAQGDGTAPSDMTLLYRHALQHRWNTRTSQFNEAICKPGGPQTRLCDISVKPGQNDAFYQKSSLWAFTYAVNGYETSEFDAEPRPLTFTLKVTAHRDPAYSGP